MKSERSGGERSRREASARAALETDDEGARLVVLSLIRGLIAEGCAECAQLGNGDILLSLATGEKFLLTEQMIVAIA